MESYCAFLRGVNVNGRVMKMSEVRQVFEKAGMSDVRTILASGNIIFRTEAERGALRGELEAAMAGHYGQPVSLFVKTGGEVAELIASVPFKEDPALHIYAFICERGFEDALMREFRGVTAAPGEDASVENGLFYWQCAKGSTLSSGFSRILGRAAMKDKFTSRNIGTLVKIAELMR